MTGKIKVPINHIYALEDVLQDMIDRCLDSKPHEYSSISLLILFAEARLSFQ